MDEPKTTRVVDRSKELNDFWFSQEQNSIGVIHFKNKGIHTCYFMRQSDGAIIRYSEATSINTTHSEWSDMQYLGQGYIYSAGGILQ
jgi:hypothetical protein